MEKREARPAAKPRRAARDAHDGPISMIAEKRETRTWTPYACVAIGWLLTISLLALMTIGIDVWAVFEIGFAASLMFGIGLGWMICKESERDDRH